MISITIAVTITTNLQKILKCDKLTPLHFMAAFAQLADFQHYVFRSAKLHGDFLMEVHGSPKGLSMWDLNKNPLTINV